MQKDDEKNESLNRSIRLFSMQASAAVSSLFLRVCRDVKKVMKVCWWYQPLHHSKCLFWQYEDRITNALYMAAVQSVKPVTLWFDA